MLRSNWSSRSTALGYLLLTLFISVFMGYVIWGSAYFLGTQSVGSQQSADYHKNYAADRIEKYCMDALSGADQIECIKTEIESSKENHRANHDLEYQRDMAYWAWIMTIVSGCTLLVTGVGVVAIFMTLTETKATVKILREEQRPWVDFVVAQGTVADATGKLSYGPEITAENFGKSLAIRVAGTITAGQTASVLPGVKGLHETLKSSLGKGIGDLNLTPSNSAVVTDLWGEPFRRVVADKGKRWATISGQYVIICVVYQDSFGTKFGTAKSFDLIRDADSGDYLIGKKELEVHY